MTDPLTAPSVRTRALSEPKPLGQVGNYQLLGVLGEGGMGIVYRARQTTIGRLVALKMIKPDAADTPATRHEATVRFQRESQAIALLRHPHIVEVYEGGVHQGRPFLAMELLDGGSLESRLRESGPMPPAAAVELILPLVEAMNAAHAAGVVHRDLKPGNVLFDQAGRPKITDFGLARRMDVANLSVTRSQEMIGSPYYMSPEQADGKPISPASDVYSLGAILYEMITGRPPLKGRSPQHTAMLVVYHQPDPPSQVVPGVSPALEAVCLRSLAKRTEQRYAHAGELLADLQRFRAGQSVAAMIGAGPMGTLSSPSVPGFAPQGKSATALPPLGSATALPPTLRAPSGAVGPLPTASGRGFAAVPLSGSSAGAEVLAPASAGLVPPALEAMPSAVVSPLADTGSQFTPGAPRPTRPRETASRGAETASRGPGSRSGYWLRLLVTLLGGGIAGGLVLGVRHLGPKLNPPTPNVDPDAELIAADGATLAETGPSQQVGARFREALKREDWTPEQRRILAERLLITEDRLLLEDVGATLAETADPDATLSRFRDALARRAGWSEVQRQILAERVQLLEDRQLLGPAGQKLAFEGLTEQAVAVLTEALNRRRRQWPSPMVKTLAGRLAQAEGRRWLSRLGDERARKVVPANAGEAAASLVRAILVGDWSLRQRELLQQLLLRVAEQMYPVMVPARTVHRKYVKALAWTADGRSIISGSDDGTVAVWDAVTLEPRANPVYHPTSSVYSNWVNQLAVSPDGTQLLTGSFGRAARLWSLSVWPEAGPKFDYDSPVTGVAYADAGRLIVVLLQSGGVRVYDAKSGEPTQAAWTSRLVREGTNNRVQPKIRRAAASTDGRHLAVAYEDGRLIWLDTTTGELVGPERQHTAVNGLAFRLSPARAELRLASVADDGTLRVWSPEANTPAWTSRNEGLLNSVADLPGRGFVTADQKGRVRTWDQVNGGNATDLGIGISHPAAGLASSPDGRFLIVAGDTNSFQVLSLPIPVPTKPELLDLWLPLFAQHRLEPNDLLVPLAAANWVRDRDAMLEKWRRATLLGK